MRVTSQWFNNAFIRRINNNYSNLAASQEKIASNRKYLSPSENPADNAIAMKLRTDAFENDQYLRNIEHSLDWYAKSDGAMTNAESIIHRIKELAVRGANDTFEELERDAMAKEVEELMKEIANIANTRIGEEYIFSGSNTNIKPIELVLGKDGEFNTSIVTHGHGVERSKINEDSVVGVRYNGNEIRLKSEVDRGATLSKSFTALEMFFGGLPNEAPAFSSQMPPLEKAMPLTVLNGGRGVQGGYIKISDQAGVEHRVDLTQVFNIQMMLNKINETRAFEAGLEQVPSDTAAALGLYRNAGNASKIYGLSDPAMRSEFTPLTDLNAGLGVPDGYLNIASRDGKIHRIDLTGSVTVKDVIDKINAHAGGSVVRASYDMVHKRIELKNLTEGKGEFSVTSEKTQFYIKALPPSTAADLGLVDNAGPGSVLYSKTDIAMDSVESPLENINDGKGFRRGFITITGHDGVSRNVDISEAKTPADIIAAVNTQTGGAQTASYDTGSNRIRITDTTLGTSDFTIEEFDGTAQIQVSEDTIAAKSLGLLKETKGTSLIGDPIAASSPLNANTPLADLIPPPSAKGAVVLNAEYGEEKRISLEGASTIQDVIDRINNSGGFYTASWDDSEKRIFIRARDGDAKSFLTARESSNTAGDLGFIKNASVYDQVKIVSTPVKISSLPTLEGAKDLDPILTERTLLRDLNSDRTFNSSGVNLGFIRITDKAGRFKAIDLRGSESIQDVLDKINDPSNGLYIRAKINSDKNGIEIEDLNRGSTGHLEVVDVDSTCGHDLGIIGRTVDHKIVSEDLDPALTERTRLEDLREGFPGGKIYIQSGTFSGEIDLSECKTVGDVINTISNNVPDMQAQAWISADKKSLNISNWAGKNYIKVLEPADSKGAAGALGFSPGRSLFTTLIDLRDSLLRGDVKAVSDITLPGLESDLRRLLNVHSEVGVKTNRAKYSEEKMTNLNLNVNKMLNKVSQADIIEEIMKMKEMTASYRASLQIGARLMQMSLMDFLG